jgi:hypothetical protein
VRVKRWLVLGVGLGVGLLGAYALLTGSSKPPRQPSVVSSTSAQEPTKVVSEPPLGEIRENSRAQLLEILRQADREDESSP